MVLADRMRRVEPSGIRRIFELMATLEDPINLSIGQAHFDPPPALIDAACAALRAGHNRYTMTQGLTALNERLLTNIEGQHGVRPDSCFITSGVSGGILLAFMAMLDEGDEVLLPDPHFTMYRVLAELCGAKITTYDLYPRAGGEHRFSPDFDEVRSKVTERTKILFINSPSNPTGGVLTRSEIEGLTAIADASPRAFVVSDEIYDGFLYVDDYASPISTGKRVLQLGGFSKTYGVPGWRMGYATGPAELLDAMKTLQQFTFVCAPAPFQHAVLEAAFDIDMQPYVETYAKKRDRLVEGLDPAFDLVPPEGSFYAFPRIPPGVESAEFIEAALERKLLIVPGSAFSGAATHFRLSFAASDETLERGIEELNALAARFRK